MNFSYKQTFPADFKVQNLRVKTARFSAAFSAFFLTGRSRIFCTTSRADESPSFCRIFFRHRAFWPRAGSFDTHGGRFYNQLHFYANYSSFWFYKMIYIFYHTFLVGARSKIISAKSKSIAAQAGAETEKSCGTVSPAFENTCVSHGYSLNKP